MTQDCPYYELERKTLERRPIGARQVKLQTIEIPWCAHPKHSPVGHFEAVNLGGDKLKCGGDRGCCMLTLEQFHDTHP